MRVHDKVVVVVGGADGIGRAVVLELLRRGARVAAVDVREGALKELEGVAGAGPRLATAVADVTDGHAVEGLPAVVREALGPPDALINVAGIIQPFVRVHELDDEVIDRVLDVNLRGTLTTVRAFLPDLLDRPDAHIANVSSMGAFVPVPGQAVYGASKAAVSLLTEALYAELGGTRVGVSLILPGAVATGIAANSGVEVPAAAADVRSFPALEPDAAARIVVDGIEADRLHVHVGRDSRLMGVLRRIAPRWTIHLVQRQMRALLGP